MRVLYIIGSLDPRSGGPASTVATLVRLSPPDCESEVVSLDDPASPFLATLDFTVHPLGPASNKFGYTPRLMPWLLAHRSRFDGVVIHGLWQYNGFAAWRAFRGRTPYVVFVHGMLDPYFKRSFPLKHLKKSGYWLAAQYWILRDAHRVLFTTAEEAQLARQTFSLCSWTSHVVRYGANVPNGGEGEKREALFRRFPELRGQRYVLFLGRIDRKKGCDLLIDAFARMAHLDPGLHLVMAGPDELGWHNELIKSITSAGLTGRVHWTGMLKGDVKWGAFLAAEAFVLPSHQENFGIAVAEALACGRPVLLSDKVNIAREIAEASAGLVEADTAQGTERLLKAWISMPAKQRDAMSVAARRLFEQNYDMRRNARGVTDLFRHSADQNSMVPAQTASGSRVA